MHDMAFESLTDHVWLLAVSFVWILWFTKAMKSFRDALCVLLLYTDSTRGMKISDPDTEVQ